MTCPPRLNKVWIQLLLLLAITTTLSAQSPAEPAESHNFITYDTAINLGYGPWEGYVWLARVTRPAIIFMSGQGEVGKDPAKLRAFGPHYWLDHGWDGGVSLGNGKHYPIIITVQPAFQYPQTPEITNILAKLLNIYRINGKAVHLCGLSQGAFAWTAMICHQSKPGDETGMKMATSIVALQGASSNVAPAAEKYKLPGWTSFGHWARKYHGKFFGLEGTADYRNVAAVERAMNDSVPGCAYFSYESYGGGGHCCWNFMFDPSVTDWTCTGAITNPNIQRNAAPNAMGSYRPGTNIFQWMLQQGDTILITPGKPAPPNSHSGKTFHSRFVLPLVIRKVAVAEYRTGYLYSDGNFYSLYNGSLIRYDYGDRKIVDVTAGFNLLLALDDQGYVWTTHLGTTRVTRIDTDTTERPFDRNTAIFGYANTHTSIRPDGSLWYWGDDTFHLCHASGSAAIRPMRLSPPGMKVKTAAMGLHRIVVLTTNGQVWEWFAFKGLTPVRKIVPGPASAIFVSQWDYAGCIIPEPGGSRTMGYPYVWGTACGFWGGKAPAPEPIPLKQLWKMKVPVKEITANFHTIHYIDSLGRLFGIGDNVMGEIGNGKALVGQSNYPGHYGWTWVRDEYLTGAPPIQIGQGIRWKHLFSDNFLAFYRYATDEQDSLYFWGRDKALVSGRGFLNLQEAAHPDAMNVLTPTMVSPLAAKFQTYNFTMPSITAGEDRTISGTSVTLKGIATPPLLVKSTPRALNGIDTIGYKIVSYKWSRLKGPAATIVNPASPETTVTGLVPGTYIFTLATKDSNEGTLSANVTITVSGPPAGR